MPLTQARRVKKGRAKRETSVRMNFAVWVLLVSKQAGKNSSAVAIFCALRTLVTETIFAKKSLQSHFSKQAKKIVASLFHHIPKELIRRAHFPISPANIPVPLLPPIAYEKPLSKRMGGEKRKERSPRRQAEKSTYRSRSVPRTRRSFVHPSITPHRVLVLCRGRESCNARLCRPLSLLWRIDMRKNIGPPAAAATANNDDQIAAGFFPPRTHAYNDTMGGQ